MVLKSNGFQGMSEEEANEFEIRMHRTERSMREQALQKYPELRDTDFFDKVFFDKEEEQYQETKKRRLKAEKRKTEEKKERIVQRDWFLVVLVWFFSSTVFGYILNYFFQPPDFLLSLFSGYSVHIKEYELFCMSMLMALALMPFSFFYYWHEMFIYITLKDPLIVTAKMLIPFLVSIFIMLELVIASMGLGGEDKIDPRTLVIRFFGWKGSIFLNIFFLTFINHGIAGIMKTLKNMRKN